MTIFISLEDEFFIKIFTLNIMILESYDKYEFQLIECSGYSSTQLIRKLNELGNNGWCIIQSYGNPFENLNNAKILMERKIISTKVD